MPACFAHQTDHGMHWLGSQCIPVSVGASTGCDLHSDSDPWLLQAAFLYIDNAIGSIINELKAQNLFTTTSIIITAKHGQSPRNPNLVRLPSVFSSKRSVMLNERRQKQERDCCAVSSPSALSRAVSIQPETRLRAASARMS